MPRVLDFAGCTVTIYTNGPPQSWCVLTRWPDGREVPAAANHSAEDVARAVALGYAGPHATWEMSHDHEIGHALVASWLGKDSSPTLRGVAEGKYIARAASDWEESLVLALQSYMNGSPAGPELGAIVWATGKSLPWVRRAALEVCGRG